MCVSLLVASALVSTVGGFVQAGAQAAAAQSEADFVRYQAEIDNRRLENERKEANIQANFAEAKRMKDLRTAMAANEAYAASSGAMYNRAVDLVGKESERALRLDIGNVRFAESSIKSRIADQISVNRAKVVFAQGSADIKGQAAWTNAFFSGTSSILKAGYQVNRY